VTKKIFFIVCLYSLSPYIQSTAQSSPYTEKQGVADSEINYKECLFDKEATAVVLVDEAVSDFDEDYKLMTFHHVKLKILKDKGIDYGNITIPFYSEDDFESIYAVEGTVYNHEGGASFSKKLDKKSVYTQKENKYWSVVKFAFPELKVGSIIEYTYTSASKNYGGLKEWVFQGEIPVLKSSYLLSIVPNAEFTYVVHKSENMHINVTPNNSEGKITFEMDNIPGLRDEKYIDSKNDYLQKVSFQLSKYRDTKFMTTWTQVNNEMFTESSFYGQLKKSLPGTEDFIKGVMQDTSALGKMKKIYSYVRNNMVWNNINSKYSSDGIKDAWEKKTGTSADLNLILINLLRDAGLDANPMLVSERYNGKVNRASTMIDQFNTVYACVAINNKQYYLDATEKYNSCQLTPYLILNTTAFIVNHKKGDLIDITDTTALYRENIGINASLNAEGILSGKFTAESFDYARGYRLKNFKTNGTTENQKLFSGNLSGLNFSDFRTENSGNDSDSQPLVTKGKFTLLPNNSKDYYFLPSNLLTGLNENPFISENRFSNINFGYNQSIQLTFYLKVDKSFTIDAVPRSIRLKDVDGDIVFSRISFDDKEQNEIRIVSTLQINQNLYPASQYDVIRDFYKRLFDLLNEKIVLKKNN
jgi:chloramphenicol O-acetyltransferase